MAVWDVPAGEDAVPSLDGVVERWWDLMFTPLDLGVLDQGSVTWWWWEGLH